MKSPTASSRRWPIKDLATLLGGHLRRWSGGLVCDSSQARRILSQAGSRDEWTSSHELQPKALGSLPEELGPKAKVAEVERKALISRNKSSEAFLRPTGRKIKTATRFASTTTSRTALRTWGVSQNVRLQHSRSDRDSLKSHAQRHPLERAPGASKDAHELLTQSARCVGRGSSPRT